MTKDAALTESVEQSTATTQDSVAGPVHVIHGVTVLITANQPVVADEQGALDLLGESWQSRAELLALPVQRLDSRFFDLSTGLAGAVLQKLVNYRQQVAILGDISAQLAASDALRAFVIESNRGQQVWFYAGLDQLTARLALGRG